MRWLHLSDLHFTVSGYNTNNLREKFQNYFEENKVKIDFILITGDCLYQFKGGNDEIKRIATYIRKVADLCHCSYKHIYLCPGNHDVNRYDEARNQLITNIRKKSAKEIDFSDNYLKLCELGIDKFLNLHKAVTSYDYEAYKMFAPRKSLFRIISLNSCLLSKDKNDGGKLRLCNNKLNEIGKKIPDDERVNIVIMHHGTEYLRNDDASKFEHWVEDHNIDIVCCGHSHRANVETYDETKLDLKQFTAGAIVLDDYAIPSFYICEYDEINADIIMDLITYSKQKEKWILDNQHIRKFENGRYIYGLKRKKNKMKEHVLLESSSQKKQDDDNIDICKTTVDKLNNKYKKRFRSDKVFSNKFAGYEKFDAWKIVSSLVETGVSYNKAFDLTKQIIDEITDENFVYNDLHNNVISCLDIRQTVYKTIVNYQGTEGETEFEISCWASRYARRYGKDNEILILRKQNEPEKLTYSYVRNILLKEVIDTVTGDDIFYEKLIRNELTRMTEGIFVLIDKMGIREIRHDVLKEITKEFMTQKPHPWLICGNREEIIAYNKKQCEQHIKDLEEKPTIISQMEAAYHLCSVFLARYDNYLGCTEISPITILNMAINRLGDKFSNGGPMQKHQVLQLKKDLEDCKIQFTSFAKCIGLLSKYIVESHDISEDVCKNVLLDLWGMMRKLEQRPKFDLVNTDDTAIRNIRRLFHSATGFIVKANLRELCFCFWVEPNWEECNAVKYHLGKQMLVCLLKSGNIEERLDKILNYLYNQKHRESSSEIVFAYENFAAFSSEERKFIRDKFKAKYCRCIFIQQDNFNLIKSDNNWREIFLDVIKISRIS